MYSPTIRQQLVRQHETELVRATARRPQADRRAAAPRRAATPSLLAVLFGRRRRLPVPAAGTHASR
jgi:hypothetical protein